MEASLVKQYVNKVVGLDFLNGLQILTKITEVTDTHIVTKDWIILRPDQTGQVNLTPYGFPFFKPLKVMNLSLDKIGAILVPDDKLAETYEAATSPIKKAVALPGDLPDLSQIDLSKFAKGSK